MERAAWAVLAALGLADKLQYIFGVLLILWLFFEIRARKQ